MSNTKLSVYLSYLLRHAPEAAKLDMDKHGWVSVDQLIEGVNEYSKYRLNRELLEEIVATDSKGRYRISEDGKRIKACQGHSIAWVEPELTYCEPPALLYHGTTMQAYGEILGSGAVEKMSRHAVHMQADMQKAWKSAVRWKKTPVVLVIDAQKMARDGFEFGVSDNEVWCTERVPKEYIIDTIFKL